MIKQNPITLGPANCSSDKRSSYVIITTPPYLRSKIYADYAAYAIAMMLT